MTMDFKIDLLSIIFQIVGAWVSASQVLIIFKKEEFEDNRLKWTDTNTKPKRTDNYISYTHSMRNIFIVGLILASIGVALPLFKQAWNDDIKDGVDEKNESNH